MHKQEIPKFVFQIAHKSEAILDEVSLLSLEEGQVSWYRYPIEKSTTPKRRAVSYTGLEVIPVVSKNANKTIYRFKSQDVMRWAFQPINCVPIYRYLCKKLSSGWTKVKRKIFGLDPVLKWISILCLYPRCKTLLKMIKNIKNMLTSILIQMMYSYVFPDIIG